ncbi:hypothetical protein QBC44DRAFT_45029 [Cladorrhinum sp. PSN332]|nr:hypothetical protein QBC44DRAFT_45029 [Cladorrhinum sp. PSN332]
MASPTLDSSFKAAKDAFLNNLTPSAKARIDLVKLEQSSIDDVYQEATKIQKQQAKTKTLRGLKKIDPLLTALKEFAAVVDVFVQAKADILSLIWGPLRLILQASSNLLAAFEGVVKVLGDIGMTLPLFKAYATLFEKNDAIRTTLCYFFEDILAVYSTLLNFVTNKRINVIIEPFWPSLRDKIGKIQANIEHHKLMMSVNVTLEEITRAHAARQHALEESQRAQIAREQQRYSEIRSEMQPEDHAPRLARVLRSITEGSGTWLDTCQSFLEWKDPANDSTPILWLHGIPGAGKTFLSAQMVEKLQESGRHVLYAFLSHENKELGETIHVLRSFLFQALQEDPSLRPILLNSDVSDRRTPSKEVHFIKDLVCTVFRSLGPLFIVLDGLDEIEESSRTTLLNTSLEIQKSCPETKVFISSRAEHDISTQLKDKTVQIRLDHNNEEDIRTFVMVEGEELIRKIKLQGADVQACSKVRKSLEILVQKSAGMFLYAKLVMFVVKYERSPSRIQHEIETIPKGLDKAYGRLMKRVVDELPENNRKVVHNLLQWVVCARRPLRSEELLQILVIEVGEDDFPNGYRKEYRDLLETCGPIIEIVEDTVRFVHFSAKEYLMSNESNRFVQLPDAHLNAALTCAAYLSYSSLDTIFSPTDLTAIKQQMMQGDFVFVSYAITTCFEHVEHAMEAENTQSAVESLSPVLGTLFELRRMDAPGIKNTPGTMVNKFKMFKDEENPDLHPSLANAVSFWARAKLGILGDSDGDPLAAFPALLRFRQSLENLMCDGDRDGSCLDRSTLTTLYGRRIYHCNKPFCHAFTHGFDTKEARDQHQTIHTRSHKCPVESCPFASVGFYSKTDLSRHNSTVHVVSSLGSQKGIDDELTMMPTEDWYPILEDAIDNNELSLVRRLFDGWQLTLSDCELSELTHRAAVKAGPDILECMLGRSDTNGKTLNRYLADAIEAGNIANVKLLLHKGANMMTSYYFSQSNLPAWEIAFITWNAPLIEFILREYGFEPPKQWLRAHFMFGRKPTPGARETLESARQRFQELKVYIPEEWFDGAYRGGPRYAVFEGALCALQICLENGGDANYYPSNKTSALHMAVRKGSKFGAEAVKLLLRYGADPNIAVEKKKATQQFVGMRKIEGYFGLVWSEIVRRIQAGEDLEVYSTRQNVKR